MLDTQMRWTDVAGRTAMSIKSDRWLTHATRVVAIGSCFARNIGRYLAAIGIPVLSPSWGNHYHAPAIENELRRALGRSYEPCHWRDASSGQVVDALRHTIVAADEGALRALESDLARAARDAFAEADAIILTLGISEIWEICVQGDDWIAVDQVPPSHIVHASRARCRFQSAAEVLGNLVAIDTLLTEAMPRRQHSVITISPIPLKQTFHNDDIRVSNNRSKGTLVSAVHDFVDARSAWSYFPAYEHFTQAGPAAQGWQRDGRHPTTDAVLLVCRAFVDAMRTADAALGETPDFAVPEI